MTEKFDRRRMLQWSAAAVSLPVAGVLAPRSASADTTITWHGWSDGLHAAASQGKAIGLYVFADWCPHCRALAPVFQQQDIVDAARKLVMIRQNADDAGPWLRERFAAYGSYVPRLYFLHADGRIAADIQSGNSKYPYYYQPHQRAALRQSMQHAAALGKG